MSFTFIYVTSPNEKEAKRISKYLFKKKLIACANIFPITSMYWWKNKIAKEKEYAIILKTTTENQNKVKQEIEKIHPYKIPCITALPVVPNERYARWLEEQL